MRHHAHDATQRIAKQQSLILERCRSGAWSIEPSCILISVIGTVRPRCRRIIVYPTYLEDLSMHLTIPHVWVVSKSLYHVVRAGVGIGNEIVRHKLPQHRAIIALRQALNAYGMEMPPREIVIICIRKLPNDVEVFAIGIRRQLVAPGIICEQ